MLTARLVSAGELLGIAVLDHVVVGDGRYVSFADQGLACTTTQDAMSSERANDHVTCMHAERTRLRRKEGGSYERAWCEVSQKCGHHRQSRGGKDVPG